MSGKSSIDHSLKSEKPSIASLAQSVKETIKRNVSQQQTSNLKAAAGTEMGTEKDDQVVQETIDHTSSELTHEDYQLLQIEIVELYKLLATGVQVEWAKEKLDFIRELFIAKARKNK